MLFRSVTVQELPSLIRSSEAQLLEAASLSPFSSILKKERSPAETEVQSSPAHLAR